MADEAPNNAYLVENTETGTKKVIRAPGSTGARNHAADGLFKVTYLKAGEVLDLVEKGLKVETAGKKAQTAKPAASQDASEPESNGGDNTEK